MNPPPLPPSVTHKQSFPHWAALVSLFIPLLVIIIDIIEIAYLHPQHPAMAGIAVDFACGVLIFLGVIAGVIALVGIPQYGSKRLLARGIIGLTVNGILSLIFITNLLVSYKKSLESRTAALQKVKSAEADIRSMNRKNFDPKTGITNADAGKLDRLSSALKDASQNLSGDDALISQAMSAHVSRIHTALTNYQSAALALRTAEVLNHFDSTNKAQFATRRELVDHFLQANTALIQAITNSENNIQDDLTKTHVSAVHIQSVIAGYHSSAAPLNEVNLRIRHCDDRMGVAILGALNLLETEWYKWSIDSKNDKLRFEDPHDLEAYNQALQEIHDAGEDQLKFQKQLVHLQQTLPQP
jgi:hypothetical protein